MPVIYEMVFRCKCGWIEKLRTAKVRQAVYCRNMDHLLVAGENDKQMRLIKLCKKVVSRQANAGA